MCSVHPHPGPRMNFDTRLGAMHVGLQALQLSAGPAVVQPGSLFAARVTSRASAGAAVSYVPPEPAFPASVPALTLPVLVRLLAPPASARNVRDSSRRTALAAWYDTRVAAAHVGDVLLAPATLWPSECCTEHGGLGWSVRVLAHVGSAAVRVAFVHARTLAGASFSPVLVRRAALLALPFDTACHAGPRWDPRALDAGSRRGRKRGPSAGPGPSRGKRRGYT